MRFIVCLIFRLPSTPLAKQQKGWIAFCFTLLEQRENTSYKSMFILSNFHHLHFFSWSKMVSTWSKSDPRIAPYCIYFVIYLFEWWKVNKTYKNRHQGCATHLSPKKNGHSLIHGDKRQPRSQSLLNGKISNHIAKSDLRRVDILFFLKSSY